MYLNPIKLRIREYVDALPSSLLPLREIGIRYSKYCCSIDTDSFLIAHRPWLGPRNYSIVLFSPAKKMWIKNFRNKRIPKTYVEVLLATNGLFAFGLSLYGLAPTMQRSTATLDRSRRQCLDLSLANGDWIREYRIDQKLFHFGGRTYSHTENIGYFMVGESAIQAYRKTGELLQQWEDFGSFLEEELYEAEQMANLQMEENWLSEGV